MREIVFDTETTGFDPNSGDRIVEIGCIELVNRMPTGENFHQYVNPEREVPASAAKIHGLTAEFLAEHPVFADVAQDFLEFVGESALVAHNADFDRRFINWELENAGLEPIAAARMIDTLVIARSKSPGAQNSLDALCRRLDIDNSHRSLHGALLDCELLSEVYLELSGGRQAGLELVQDESGAAGPGTGTGIGEDATGTQKKRARRSFPPSEEELAAHAQFLDKLKNPVWAR